MKRIKLPNDDSDSDSDSDNERNPMSSEVVTALMENDVDRLKRLREAGEHFDCCDEERCSLLHLAILDWNERNNFVKRFGISHLEGAVYLDILDESDKQKFLKRFSGNHTNRAEAFDYLLTLDEVDKNFSNSDSCTPLEEIFTFLQNSPQWAIKLINSGCEIGNYFYNCNSALHWAVHNDWDEVAELLIEKGIDIDASNRSSETALFLACKLGRVDLIWMLLFYGADPNKPTATSENNAYIGNCFDLAIKGLVCKEVQEIFLEMSLGFKRCFSMKTFETAAKSSSPDMFHKLCETGDDIVNFEYRFIDSFQFNPPLFKLLVEKYSSVFPKIFRSQVEYYLRYLNDSTLDKNALETLSANIFTLMESDFVELVIGRFNDHLGSDISLIVCLIRAFKQHEDELTKLLFHLLNYGLSVTNKMMDEIYDLFGYSSLFKMLLYTDIEEAGFAEHHKEVIPPFYYNLELTPERIIEYFERSKCCYEHCKYFHLILEYFALPKLVEGFTKNMESCDYDYNSREVYYYIEDGEYYEDYVVWKKQPKEQLRERIERLPTVPKLQELARNKAREHIISKYEIKKCQQYYTVVNWLPIAKLYKEILTYERPLY